MNSKFQTCDLIDLVKINGSQNKHKDMSLERNLQMENDGDRGKQNRDQRQNALYTCMKLSENNVKKSRHLGKKRRNRRNEKGGRMDEREEERWKRRRKKRRVEEKDEGWK